MNTTAWGWVDAEYAGCKDTRKSHTGYVLMLNGAYISWKSKRQATVSLSSAESKFIVAGQCGQEVRQYSAANAKNQTRAHFSIRISYWIGKRDNVIDITG